MTRAIVAQGEQASFLKAVKGQLGVTWKEIADICRVNKRTLFRWICEETNISHEALMHLHKLTGVPLPLIIEVISEEERLRRAGRKGGKRSYELYGKPGTPESWSKGGQEAWQRRQEHPELYLPNPVGTRKEVLIPQQSPQLAELVGILLGDGGIYDEVVSIGLHGTNEIDYAEYARRLFAELFGLRATIWIPKDSNSRVVMVYSVALIEHLESIGLQKGNKVAHQVSIPDWIFSSKDCMEACVRGLMDTDGGPCRRTDQRVFPARYYVRLVFKNSSRPLIDGVWRILTEFGYRVRRYAKTVELNRQEGVRRYYAAIGTSNAYHRERYLQLAKEAWGRDLSCEVKWLG